MTNLNQYSDFVKEVTSLQSNDFVAFVDRCQELNDLRLCNVPLLLTSAVGLSSESGELSEIVKKVVFQGKNLNKDVVFHMKRELGDILWYWVNACRALNLDPNEVMTENITKLKARYPDGKFDDFFSENRREGDL